MFPPQHFGGNFNGIANAAAEDIAHSSVISQKRFEKKWREK